MNTPESPPGPPATVRLHERRLIRHLRVNTLRLTRGSRRTPLIIKFIAVGKLIKAGLFLAGVFFVIHVVESPALADAITTTLTHLHIDPQGAHARQLIAMLTGLSPERWMMVAAGMSSYAALYLIEGLGLWFDRPWAEWFTVIMTGLFIPFEALHLLTHPSFGIAMTLLINLTIVLYLAWRIRSTLRQRKQTNGF